MKIFISWSGEISGKVARTFRDWLPYIFPNIQPYVSAEDIHKGTRWTHEIATELDTSNFGLLCLTPDNVSSPWLNFEAGALSMSIQSDTKTNVCPFLFGLESNEISSTPLSQFQAVKYDKDDIRRLIHTLNNFNGHAVKEDRLDEMFNTWWPKLYEDLEKTYLLVRKKVIWAYETNGIDAVPEIKMVSDLGFTSYEKWFVGSEKQPEKENCDILIYLFTKSADSKMRLEEIVQYAQSLKKTTTLIVYTRYASGDQRLSANEFQLTQAHNKTIIANMPETLIAGLKKRNKSFTKAETMRTMRICTIPEEFVQTESKEIIHKTFHFSLITPMFGGNAQSWRLNLKNPVRSQAVKGQLRFWWRTMQHEKNIKALIDMENRIWGGRVTDKANKKISIRSRVSLSIDNAPPVSKHIIIAEMENKYAVKDDLIPRYVLFPITPEVKNENTVHMIKAFDFYLSIAFPVTMEKTIMNVLTLWTLFGGVGARTRRGTGSLYCEELLKNFSSERDILECVNRAAGKETNGQPPETIQLGYPRIAGAGFYASTVKNAEPAEIWRSFLKKYGDYRQDRRPPGKDKKPGKSYWPEPDAIRLLTGDKAKDHEPKHPDEQWFPRAAMGLPIIFKFITPGDPGKNGEKKGEITLEPDIGDKRSRFPSSVILKVIKLPNNQVIKCAFVLNQSFPRKLKLTLEGKDPMAVQGNMLPFYQGYQDEKTMNTKTPLAGRSIFQHLADHLGLEEVK